MGRFLAKQKLIATRKRKELNDCPSNCDKKHCDVCQFADNTTHVPKINFQAPSPECYGRDL